MPTDLSLWQIALGAIVGLMVGLSKTGVPGLGILTVPVIAMIFGGRLSVGALLPLLIVADVFAVAYYREHTIWSHLRRLAPWVLAGMALGGYFLWRLGLDHGKDWLNPIIGGIVLAMLGIHLLRARLGTKLTPGSPIGVAATGALAGFTTLVSNAAGPVMSIYMTALGLAKTEFMGTLAWYFLIFNCSKIPVYAWLTLQTPDKPMFTATTLVFDLLMTPFVVAGSLLGRRIMPMIPEKAFTQVVLSLAMLAALRMLFT